MGLSSEGGGEGVDRIRGCLPALVVGDAVGTAAIDLSE